MWDEKKFFEDYVSETEKMTPDADFVKNLKETTMRETQKKNYSSWIRYGVVAAAILCIVTGIAAWGLHDSMNGSKNGTGEGKIHAEKEEQVQSGNVTVITIKAVLECMEDENAVIMDETGGRITDRQRSELADMLKNAVLADYKPAGDEKYDKYKCTEPTEFALRVYASGYIVVEESGMVYKV